MAIVHTLRLKHYADAFTITSSPALSLSLSSALSAHNGVARNRLSFTFVLTRKTLSCWYLMLEFVLDIGDGGGNGDAVWAKWKCRGNDE